MRDIVSKHGTIYSAFTPPAHTGSLTGQTIDLAPYNGAMVYIIAGTWTDGTHTFTIQEAPDNGSGSPGAWSNVATTDLITWTATSATVFTPVKVGNAQPAAISSAATAINQRVGYIGGMRFIRVNLAVAGATTGAQYDVVVEAGEPRLMPAAV